MNNQDFFDELKEKYSVEDFTGHIGVLLDDGAGDDEITESRRWLQAIDQMAVKYL